MNTSKTPTKNTQEYSSDSCSRKEISIDQQESKEKTNNQSKKKKCHGNRKEQHKRRRLRRHQQHQEQVDQIDLNDHLDNNQIQDQQQQRQEMKRKRPDSNQDNLNISKSLSQLSISKGNQPKRKRTITSNPVIHEENNTIQNTNDIPTSKPQYLQVSDTILKQMLSHTIEHGEKLVECLNTKEKLQLIRQITELTNQTEYFTLQQSLWQDYYNLGIKEDQWAPKLSKSFARHHQTCRTYGYRQHTIEKRQKTIENQLQRTKDELKTCYQKLEESIQQWEPSLDINHLSKAIVALVEKGLQRLKQDFEYKRKRLELDANDHHFIKLFYQLKPNQEQVELAKQIWQTTADELKMKEYEEVLRKRIYLQRLPSDTDHIINQSIYSIEHLLSNPLLNKDRRACLISTCSKTITQYKFDLMTILLETIQNIRYDHQELLFDLHVKLNQSNWNETIKKTIENRQETIIQRYELYLKQKLHSFFDEAPMV